MARSFPVNSDTNSTAGFFFLLLYTVALFVRPQEWTFHADPFPYARILLIISFLAYIVLQRPKIWGIQGWCLFGILLLIPLSGLRNGWFGGGITQGIDFFIYSLVPFLLYSSLVSSQAKHRLIFYVFAIALVFMLHHGITQKFSPDGIGWTGEPLSQGTRITYVGFFNDPNDLAMFFIMNIPIMMYMSLTASNFITKLTFFVIAMTLFYGVFLTNSRGGLVGLMALIMTFIYFRYGKIKTFFLGAITLPAAYVAMSMFRTIDSKEESAYGRIEAWYEGIQMFKYRPLFGVGKGGFIEHHKRTAHNSYVLMLAELGALGYLMWFMLIALTLLMLIKVFTLEKSRFKEKEHIINDIFLAKCLFLSFIGFLATAFFLTRTFVVFLYVFIGLAVAVYYRVQKEAPEIGEVTSKNSLLRILAAGLLSLIGLYFIIVLLL